MKITKSLTAVSAIALLGLILTGCGAPKEEAPEADVPAISQDSLNDAPAEEPVDEASVDAGTGYYAAVSKFAEYEDGAQSTEDFGIWQRQDAVAIWIRNTQTNEVKTWVADGYTVDPEIESALSENDLSGPFFNLMVWNRHHEEYAEVDLRTAATQGLPPSYLVFFITLNEDEPLDSPYISKG
ncbi:hypothetical protein [Microbacterium sp. KR10-403]|uniref:hypothetical protein n=1 Tax=Microbacterium sp. KR10-403 TaxID=3158581 RepID=UPI0032E4F87A